MAINVTTSKQQIQAAVADEKITANVSAGFGAVGPSGVVNVTAPITNTGTTTNANVGIALGSSLSVSDGTLVVTPGTYATLVDNKIPSALLPSYVDDVLEYNGIGNFPGQGETSKIYVTLDTNKTYRWTGSTYVEISPSPGSTDSISEGVSNLYFTNYRAAAAAPVQSVNGKTGTVALTHTDVTAAASSHTHNASAIDAGTLSASRLPIASSGSLGAVRIGSGVTIDGSGIISVSTSSGAWDDITGKPSTFTPSSHTHGNITNDGKVGSAADKVLVTTTAGAVTATSTLTFTHLASTSTYTNFNTSPGSLATALSDIDSALTTALGDPAWADITGKPSGTNPSGEVPWYNGAVFWDSDPSTGPKVIVSYAGITFADGSSQSTAGAALSHAHSAADVTSGTLDIARLPTGSTSTTVCIGNDARLSDARTPTAHNHAASDINSGVLATARLASSGTASATTFLRGDQTWATAGSTNASDLTSGTLGFQRLPARVRSATSLYLWSSFR